MTKLTLPVLVTLIAASAAAQLPVLAEHLNPQFGQELGTAVAAAGDVDGDGLDDVVVGLTEPGLPPFAPAGPGAVRVYAGDGTMLLDVPGGSPGTAFGSAVTGLGDVNGDGVPDVAVGAPLELGVGRVHLISGADGSIVRSLQGTGPLAFFGAALAALADLDGDGVRDIAVGAPGHTGGSGRVAVFSSATGVQLFDAFGSFGDQLGKAVADAGDFDFDSVSDVVVGAPGSCDVRVLSGAGGTFLAKLGGSSLGGDFGASVCGLGDLGGDGVPELVVGAPGASGGGFMSGRVLVVSGADGSVVFSFDGQLGGDTLGTAVCAGVDLDADGVADFVATAPGADVGDAGTGLVRGWSGADGSEILAVPGHGGQALGKCVAVVGDTSGDGLPDVVSGSPSAALGGGFFVLTVIGSRRYGTGLGGTQQLSLDWMSVSAGAVGWLTIVGAGPFAFGAIVGAVQPAMWQSGPHDILVDPYGAEFAILGYDQFGGFDFPVGLRAPAFAGRLIFLQAFAEDLSGITTSNGLELLFAD